MLKISMFLYMLTVYLVAVGASKLLLPL